MTGDDHGNGGTSGQFDWAQERPAGELQCRGLGLHPADVLHLSRHADHGCRRRRLSRRRDSRSRCTSPRTARTGRPASLEGFYAISSRSSRATTRASPPPRRTAPTASRGATGRRSRRSSSSHGIRLDTNYYYWPDVWVQDRPGYFTGSGMPMRFADLDGSMIDVYQATTQMTDESGITYSTHINTLLDNAIGAPGYYGVVTANMHTDNPNHPGQQTDRQRGHRQRRPGRVGEADADLARRPERLVVRVAVVGREQPQLHDRRRLGRERPAGDGPDDVGGRCPHRHHPQRRRRSRSRRRRSRASSTRSSRPPPASYEATYAVDYDGSGHQRGHGRAGHERHQPPSPGRPTSRRRRASTTGPQPGP